MSALGIQRIPWAYPKSAFTMYSLASILRQSLYVDKDQILRDRLRLGFFEDPPCGGLLVAVTGPLMSACG